MSIQQISIFVENKSGRLAEIAEILANAQVDIRALSIADTSDYGILRLIVNNPAQAVNALKSAEITASITPVLAISINDIPGGFAKAVRILSDGGISVEYSYAFITPNVGNAYIILRVEDNAKAIDVLQNKGIKLISQEEVFNI